MSVSLKVQSNIKRLEISYFPLLAGVILKVTSVTIQNRPISIALITRRSRYNQGTRYFSRGVDEEGNVANYAETEEIVEFSINKSSNINDLKIVQPYFETIILSQTQIRGSIPLSWAQVINGLYKPQLVINEANSTKGFLSHCNKIQNDYKRVLMINLVDKKKYEKPIGAAFGRMVNSQRFDNIAYIHLDFHSVSKELGKNVGEELARLVSDEISAFGGYRYSVESELELGTQSGVFRTNCMDCLDRTNVVQSMVANQWLTRELRHFSILSYNQQIEDFPSVHFVLRNLWADNADIISLAYSGTPALKTDLTRTGKRTIVGIISDGVNSIGRYIHNNYFDGFRQDSFDLMLGKYRVSNGVFIDNETNKLVGYGLVSLAFLLFIYIYSTLYSTYNLSMILSMLLPLVGIIFLYCMLVIILNRSYPIFIGYMLNWPVLKNYPYSYSPTSKSSFILPQPYSVHNKRA
ncbi:hypothetical protein BB559_003781 [Furculomyces boomerangus]|uniref:SAC domain-containing protein n=1 Tax=Furculomyces boomerangus TaxID=61424 RepID=A0A2T9YIX5_9FUNG|nr:hypothetical protein BB559_003781 [Furculomyces boomerangus]